jgi:MFS superfamily sulfate permease-like transporter
MGVFIVAYTDNLLTARMFAVRHRQHINGNRELLALGASNLASAVVSGFPVSSSASRAVIGEASGARTQAASLVAAAGVLAVLLGLPGVLASFPVAALGGLVIYAATRLVDVSEFRRLWSFRRREFALAVGAAASVLAFDILYGVLAAIGLSILELLTRVARPHAAVLGQAPGVAGWHDVDDYPGTVQVPGLLVYRYDSPLFFANADDFRRRVESAVDSSDPRPRWLLLNMEANVEVDITGLDALERIRRHCADEGVVVALVRVKHDVLEDLRRHGVVERIGEDHVYPTLPTAVQGYLDWRRSEG